MKQEKKLKSPEELKEERIKQKKDNFKEKLSKEKNRDEALKKGKQLTTLRYLTNKIPEIKQIKNGIHNNKYYFALQVYDDDDEELKTAIITSERDLFIQHDDKRNEIKRKFGLEYKYDFEEVVLDNKIERETIFNFITGEYKKRTLKEIYEDLENLNKKYMYYPDEKTHKFIALDIISTYFMACFRAKGRIFLEAEKGSGKTRQCSIYKNTSCNSLMTNDISKSAFFRIVESTVTTLIIDDFDDINDEQKTDMIQLYKTGYKNDSKSVRVGDNQKRNLDTFRTYGHVIMNNTQGIDNVSSERSIFLKLLKTRADITTKDPQHDYKFKEISQELYIYALDNWQLVKNSYETVTSKLLKGRELEISKSILCLASLISEEEKNNLELWISDSLESNAYVDFETDWDYILWTTLGKLNNGDNIFVKDIAEKIMDTLDTPAWERKKEINRKCVWVGKKLTKSPLVRKILINNKSAFKLLNKDKLNDFIEVSFPSSSRLGVRVGEGMFGQENEKTPGKPYLNLTYPNPSSPTLTYPNPNIHNTILDLSSLKDKIKDKIGLNSDTSFDELTTYFSSISELEIRKNINMLLKVGDILEVKPDIFRLIL